MGCRWPSAGLQMKRSKVPVPLATEISFSSSCTQPYPKFPTFTSLVEAQHYNVSYLVMRLKYTTELCSISIRDCLYICVAVPAIMYFECITKFDVR